MARKYARDNRGRFAPAGTGATARGGRLKTSGGGKRATQTMRGPSGGPRGTVGKPKGLKPDPNAKRSGSAPKPAKEKGQQASPKTQGAPKRLKFQVLYHGTSKDAANAIRKGGFKESGDGFLGKGVYFSRDKRVAGYYKSVAEGKSGGGAVIKSRVLKDRVTDVKQDSFFVASAKAKKSAQGLLRKGRSASLQAPDDIQKVVATTAKTANRGLIRETGKIRRRRRRP